MIPFEVTLITNLDTVTRLGGHFQGLTCVPGHGLLLLRQSFLQIPKDLRRRRPRRLGTGGSTRVAVPWPAGGRCRRRVQLPRLVEQLSVALVVTGDNNNVRTGRSA